MNVTISENSIVTDSKYIPGADNCERDYITEKLSHGLYIYLEQITVNLTILEKSIVMDSIYTWSR